MSRNRNTNRLIGESSPYLRQHAHNPVDWHPWDEEALALSRRLNRPIFLSVGYSACHWCHVMERECFENEEIASSMNEHFVNIKVDREERPDLDDVYMNAVQLMTGSGGWPMSVFLTPDGVPFYGGTYFPPESRYGRPGFKEVLLAVSRHYREQPDKVLEMGGKMLEELRRQAALSTSGRDLGQEALSAAFSALASGFDWDHGGFGEAPKFPGSMSLTFMLRRHARTGDVKALDMVRLSLGKMANGGVYDQLGGGFHRYSVDEKWLVPHFEKMLYDNALLARLYIEAHQHTGDAFCDRIGRETLDYVLREMQDPHGGFYATQDADSEGREGAFFVWNPDELKCLLGEEEGDLLCRYYDVTPQGNFETSGDSVLSIPVDREPLARFLDLDTAHLDGVIERGREALLQAREKREKPARDEKVLAGWNGLMISAFASGARAFGDESYAEAGARAARFVLDRMRTEEGLLLHVYKDGQARFPAYQDDYAAVASALVDLYDATLDAEWLFEAEALVDRMVEQFWDPDEGGFFYIGRDHEELVVRSKNPHDNAVPSGNSLATGALLRLGRLLGREDLVGKAERTLRLFEPYIRQVPGGFGQMACALDAYLQAPLEVVILGDPTSDDTRALLSVLNGRWLPDRVLVGLNPGEPDERVSRLPLVAGKHQKDGRATAYVCRNAACSEPVTTPAELSALLD
jgi:uncharacterized protein